MQQCVLTLKVTSGVLGGGGKRRRYSAVLGVFTALRSVIVRPQTSLDALHGYIRYSKNLIFMEMEELIRNTKAAFVVPFAIVNEIAEAA